MKCLGFLTSGGDAPGMNAAIRSIVRTAIHNNWTPFAINGGFNGLLDGDITEMTWEDGGTVIRSSRCPEFHQKNFRKKAVYNLVSKGIYNLIVIGGDGSLTGAEYLRSEWSEHISDLVLEGSIPENANDLRFSIIGLVGSIDNDMCGTEITIGSNTSLHRIVEALDNITSTAMSHSRAFVIEVMGRNCGWLALNASKAIGADYVFIPERPPPRNWAELMSDQISRNISEGRKITFVIVSEGAVDSSTNPITSQQVKEAIVKNLGMDARVTTLGHVQRGGAPSAFDRYLATMQGITATLEIIQNKNLNSLSTMIGINENQITLSPITDCVERTRRISAYMKAKKFDIVFESRDSGFKFQWKLYNSLYCAARNPETGLNFGLLNIGAPCGGMNAANYAITKYCHQRGHAIFGISDGIKGLISRKINQLFPKDVEDWIGKGGSSLGTNRWVPTVDSEITQFVDAIIESNLHAILMIGGFEGFSLLKLLHKSKIYLKSQIPIILIPATISNNVPGTEFSIGSDTAVNTIISSCDIVRQSASSSSNRVFVVEVQGGNCGYLATISALSSGASCCLIPEIKVDMRSIMQEVEHLKSRYSSYSNIGRVIIRNENCSKVYSTEFLSKIIEEESNGAFDSRWLVLGHLQQGASPSPLDRLRGVKLGIVAVDYIEMLLSPDLNEGSSIAGLDSGVSTPMSQSKNLLVVGVKGPKVVFSPIDFLLSESDFSLRVQKNPWWMRLYPLISMLSRGPSERLNDK